MTNPGKVHARTVENFQAAYAAENAAYQQASVAGDIDEMSRAAASMAGLRATMRELNTMAQEAINQQHAAAPANRWGLSPLEVEVAHKSFGAIKNQRGDMVDLTDDQKEESYARQKQRLAYLRSTGQYRHTTEQTG